MGLSGYADEIVGLLTRAVGVVDEYGNLHAPKGLGKLSGRFVGDGLPRADRHLTGAWVEADYEAALGERIRLGAKGFATVMDRKGLKGYFHSYVEFVKETLADKRVYHNGPHTITVDGDVGQSALRLLSPNLDRLIRMYPPSGPLNVHVVSAARMRRIYRKVRGAHPLGFAERGGHSMTLSATAVFRDSVGPGATTVAHEYGHLMDVHGDGHADLWERFRDEMDDYAASSHVEAFASMFALWDDRRGMSHAGPAARAYAERYGWKRG